MILEYDIGDGLQKVEVKNQNFSDGQYHIVRFVRDGRNVTFEIDNYPIIHHFPTGKHSNLHKQSLKESIYLKR